MRSRFNAAALAALALASWHAPAEPKTGPIAALSCPRVSGDGRGAMKKKSPTSASAYTTELRKLLEEISGKGHRRGEVLRAFALFAACTVAPRVPAPEHPHGSVSVREDEYMAEVKRWTPEDMALFSQAYGALVEAMEAQPYTDLFGQLHQEWRAEIDRKAGGEFYTPQSLCQMMARMNLPEELPADRPLEVSEPACGVGGMVLSVAEALTERGISPLCMRATCVDVDRAACDMCFVNLTLWGIPATVVHGNALSLETWGAWRNVFWPLARGTGKPSATEQFTQLRAVVEEAVATIPTEEPAPLTVEGSAQFAFDLDLGESRRTL